jgi:signal transduction histidine kinase
VYRFSLLRVIGGRTALAVLAAMVVVGLLAYEQYRWIGQVASVQQKTSRDTLEEAVQGFADDVDTEITRAQLLFLGMSGASRSDVLQSARERWQLFKELSPYPGLIAAVDVDESVPDGHVIAAAPSIALVVPASLTSTTNGSFAGHGQPSSGGLSESGFHVGTGTGVHAERAAVNVRVTMDDTYLVASFLPRVLKRRFGPDFERRYDVLVYWAAGGRSVFHVGTEDDKQWEFRRPLFAVRPDCLLGQESPTYATADGPVTHDLTSLLRRSGACHPSSRVGSGAWNVGARLRPPLAGSFEAVRLQNLSVGFGLLLILAGAMALISLSAHRARELAALHEQFAASVSHELRTPLSIISSAAENLAEGVVQDAKQVRQYGEMIHTRTEQLAEMIENALWFAGKHGKDELDVADVDVEHLIAAAIATCGSTLAKARVVLERDIEPELPAVRGHWTLLLHALENLLTNVAKHAHAGRWAQIRAVREGRYVLVAIEDRGDGIPSDEAARVFEAFYRGRRATTGQIAGLGLGLALVKRVAEAHSGTVTLRSKRGVGTLVELRIPITAAIESNGTAVSDVVG